MRTGRFEATDTLTSGLTTWLAEVRRLRGFDVDKCCEAKILLINEYFRMQGLSSAVVGVSGGIDSAVTLSLLVRASRQAGSPIKRIMPLLLPFSIEQGVSNQESATTKGRSVVQSLGLQPHVIDLAQGFWGVRSAVSKSLMKKGDSWADGQLAAYLRTPALYYAATLSTQEGFPAIVCGTTNRDEGAYIGFFGKASDGMTDLQIISDLHKSEVYALGALLNVPFTVMTAAPTGDVFDGKTHSEMIGASYDFIELYLHYLCSQKAAPQNLDEESQARFITLAEHLEAMHRYNAHKYLGGNPSVHLDVYPRAVPGGWKNDNETTEITSKGPRQLVGEFSMQNSELNEFSRPAPNTERAYPLADCSAELSLLPQVLYGEECRALITAFERKAQIPVGINGRVKDYNPSTDTIGSYRATLYSEELAALLWERIRGRIPQVRCFDEYSMTDSNGHQVWRAIGINPSLRFIKYGKGGSLVPHYDAGFDYKDGKRHTLVTVVLYLTDGEEGCGGRTRFIVDPQRGLPASDRDYSDWKRRAREDEVLFANTPCAGSALLFDHRMLHDAEEWSGSKNRIIIRTDIIFQKCGSHDSKFFPRNSYSRLASEEQESKGDEPDPLFGKIIRDPFYRHAARLFSTKEIIEGGFFDDGAETRLDLAEESKFLCTALHKIRRNHASLRQNAKPYKPVVLLTTGGFSPIHKGHLAMMDSARLRLEREGYSVLGGFFSPDHDSYIIQKSGDEALLAHERLNYIDIVTRESSWLAADPWAAMHCDRPLNFTDVICRMEYYLARHLRGGVPIQVVYVCGGDNALFARAFTKRGMCVIVHRIGDTEKIQQVQSEIELYGAHRILLTESLLPQPAASRAIRGGDLTCLPESIREAWEKRGTPKPKRIQIYIRDEGAWLLEPWTNCRDMSNLKKATSQFLTGLKNAFRLLQQQHPSECDFQVYTLSAEGQREALQQELENSALSTISLDSVIHGDYALGISRCFELVDSYRRECLMARPGSPELNDQLSTIPAGDYVLYDDDIATGRTIRELVEKLPKDCVVRQTLSLFSLATGSDLNTVEMDNDTTVRDVGDLRDFLVGSRDGGLVVALPNGRYGRAPYLLPYVRNNSRMSIPTSVEYLFSKLVWSLNVSFFQMIEVPITIRECSDGFKAFALSLGWNSENTVLDFAEWHLNQFREKRCP